MDGSGWCAACRPAAEVQQAEPEPSDRASAAKRGYDRTWRGARAAYLAAHPWCEATLACKDLPITRRVATQVHHKQAISVSPDLRLTHENFMAVCMPCHVELERREREWRRISEGGGWSFCFNDLP